jgi:hypothetical protein
MLTLSEKFFEKIVDDSKVVCSIWILSPKKEREAKLSEASISKSFGVLLKTRLCASSSLDKPIKRRRFFGKFFEKDVDDDKAVCSVWTLSPKKEAIFEKYIVRLIGTPNQNL